MHRSGTSALARVLSLLGCDLPKTLMGVFKGNETGHWESEAIRNFNDTVLESAGSAWDDWLAFNPGWYRSPKADEFKMRAVALLADEFGSSRLFVLKDPRICRMLPFWLGVFDAANIMPAIILLVRNPLEVAASLEKRDDLDPSLGQLLWLRHVLEAEAASRGLIRFHCSYDALMNGWAGLALSAQETLGFSFPRLSQQTAEEVEAFLRERLRHHRVIAKSVVDNPMLSAWLRDAFRIFEHWAEDGERPEDFVTLDRIRAEFDAAAPAFARLVASGQRAAQRAQGLQHELAETESRLNAALAARAEEVQRLQAKLSHTESELAQRRHEAEETAAELLKARQQLTRQQTEAAGQREEAQRLQAKLSHTESELAKRRNEAEETAAGLAQAKEQLREMETRLNERFGEIAMLTRFLREKEDEAKQVADRAEWMRQISALLLGGGSWRGKLAWLLPGPLAYALRKIQLKRRGLFDAKAYLREHPDVARSGADPLRHYLNHGLKEGRAGEAERVPAKKWTLGGSDEC
jgi:hypothetical protein